MTRTYRPWRYIAGIAVLMLLSFATAPACAVTPDEVLQDTRLETRARELSEGLRCLVCQNQNIDDSNAPLAHDLRVLLRERLVSGDTDQQAVDYIVARYGNFVLLKPPVQLDTLFLWAGPALFFLIAAIGTGRYLRRSIAEVKQPSEPLSPTEQARLDALLDRGSA